MQHVLILATFVAATMATGFDALACTCAPINSRVQHVYDYASAVFLGVPIATQSVATEDPFNSRAEETIFRVVSAFKGPQKDTVIRSQSSSAACGVRFKPDSGLYLIFAFKDEFLPEELLKTSLCTSSIIGPNNPTLTSALKQLAEIAKP